MTKKKELSRMYHSSESDTMGLPVQQPQSQAHGVALWTFERIALVSAPCLTHQLSFKPLLKLHQVLTPIFLFPSTLSGVLVLNGVLPPSFFTSA